MQNGEVGSRRGLRGICATSSLLTTLADLLRFARLGRRWRPLLFPLLLVAAAAVGLTVDCPLARWCVERNCPRFLGRLFGAAEPFGNGFGVLLIGLAIYALDRHHRGALARVLAMSLGAGLAANMVKMLVTRVRPYDFNFEGTVGDTFGQWLPLVGEGAGGQSFPSAHTATAVGLALALAWLYPRGRWLFAALAVMVACQRVEGGAHYLSDTFGGAAIGWLVATACLHGPWLAARFGRFERRRSGHRRKWVARPLLPLWNKRFRFEATGEKP